MIDGKGYKPGSIRGTPREKRPTGKSNDNYKFSKKIYRIHYKDQIMPLFDNGVAEKSDRYYGRILSIPIRIDFSLTRPCTLNAKTQEDLNMVYNEVIKALIGR